MYCRYGAASVVTDLCRWRAVLCIIALFFLSPISEAGMKKVREKKVHFFFTTHLEHIDGSNLEAPSTFIELPMVCYFSIQNVHIIFIYLFIKNSLQFG
jgi:hypothetical protein